MEKFKKYGSFILGLIFIYDFLHTLSSNTVETYDVVGLEVSKITYLGYLLAIAVSFISYGLTKHFEKNRDERDEFA